MADGGILGRDVGMLLRDPSGPGKGVSAGGWHGPGMIETCRRGRSYAWFRRGKGGVGKLGSALNTGAGDFEREWGCMAVLMQMTRTGSWDRVREVVFPCVYTDNRILPSPAQTQV